VNRPVHLGDPAHISRLLVIEIYLVPGQQLTLHEIVLGLLAWLPSQHVLSTQTMVRASITGRVRRGAAKHGAQHNSEQSLSSP